MKIRGKLLILLLIIAIAPLLFTTFYGFATLRNMGDSLADKAGQAQLERTENRLQLMLQYNARMLRQKRELVEASLKLLANAAENALSRTDPASEAAYPAPDFDHDKVPQTYPSERHFRMDESGKPRPVWISTEAQVLHFAPGVELDDVADSILRLSSLTPSYRAEYEQNPDLYYWIYISLEDGTHSSFPGHGGYPAEYDGRARDWYSRAVATGDTVWSAFLVDATTGQAIATASRPIYFPDKSLAGVAAIDVPVQAMLNQIRMEVLPDSMVFLAKASVADERPGLELLATLEEKPRDWREVPEMRTLTMDDPAFQAMLGDIVLGKSGVRRINYGGNDFVWAYGTSENSAHALVVTLPFADVSRRVQETKDYITSKTLSIVPLIGLFVVILTGAVLVIAWGSSRSITNPLRDLAGAAQRLASGDFETRVPVRSKDEIGQLSGVFNDIAPQLLDRMKARESLTHLGRYFSPNLAEQLTENPDLFNVGGERRELTFVFTDLAGFTSLVEASRPEDIIPILNEYLDGMTRIVWEHDGTIDKVVGDAVHAMFGAPLHQPDHTARGVQCALDMDQYSESFRAEMRKKGVEIGITRIGVNTGAATVGNFGGELMFDYTAHGDAINTAARLEGANKFFGTRIAVSENTSSQIDHFQGRPIGCLVLKGRSSGLRTFEPLSDADYSSPRVQGYLEAYASLAGARSSALSKFTKLAADFPADPLIRFHLDRLEAGEHGELVTLAGK